VASNFAKIGQNTHANVNKNETGKSRKFLVIHVQCWQRISRSEFISTFRIYWTNVFEMLCGWLI